MKMFSRLALLLAFSAIILHAQENYSTWTGHRNLALNTSSGGANVTGNVLNFPVLVRLGASDSAVFAASKTKGADIRFTKAGDVVRRPHQIEHWDSAGRTAAVWVLVDTVKGNNNSQVVRMHWGNAAAADSSKGTAVFDTGAGYKAVFHFSEGTANDTAFDATQNAFKGAPMNGGGSAASYDVSPQDTVGIIGRARRYGATGSSPNATSGTSGNYYQVLNSASGPLNIPEDANYTVSGWANVNAVGTSRSIASKGDRQYYLELRSSGRQWEFSEYQVGTGWEQTFSDTIKASTALETATNNQWQHMAGVRSGTTAKLYWNGVVVDSAISVDGGTTTARITNLNFNMGKNPTANDRFWRGELDEIRVAGISRSADWIKLEYENQKAAQTLVIELLSVANLRYVPGNTATNDTVVFSVGSAAGIVPTFAGGPVDSFKVVSGTLPAGITVNKTTGALGGTATAAVAASSVVVRAWGHVTAGDSTSRTVVVSSVLGALSNLHYSPDTTTYTVGIPVSKLPTYSGRAATKFKASALPAGLSLDSVTGLLSGTPTAASAATNYTVTATNTTGPDTATRVLRLTVATESGYATTWSQHQTLWLNTQTNGAPTTATVTNFPVLVRLDSAGGFSAAFTQSVGRGTDLRFTKAGDAVRLPHQLEHWDSAGKKASIWVLVDTVAPNSRTQTIRMHWGNAAAVNASSGPSVFDTARSFRTVLHFSEGTSDTAFDATQYAFKAIPQRTATTYNFPEDTVGAVGRARRYGIGPGTATTNNAGAYFTVAGSAAPLDFPQGGPFTLSSWAIVNVSGTSRTFVSKSDRAYGLEFRNTGADWEFAEHNTAAGGWQVAGSPAATAGIGGVSTIGVWTHIMGVRNGTTSVLYVNGVAQTQALRSDANTNAHVGTLDLNIGRAPDNNTSTTARYYWRGVLDEVRVAQTARSADWAKLEYENQKAAQSLVWTTQPPVSIGGRSAMQAAALDFSVKAAGAGLLFRLQGQTEGRSVLSLVDMWGRTVWSGAFSSGASELAWDGRGSAGNAVSAGVYVARLTVLDKQGKAVKVMDKKVPYTR